MPCLLLNAPRRPSDRQCVAPFRGTDPRSQPPAELPDPLPSNRHRWNRPLRCSRLLEDKWLAAQCPDYQARRTTPMFWCFERASSKARVPGLRNQSQVSSLPELETSTLCNTKIGTPEANRD